MDNNQTLEQIIKALVKMAETDTDKYFDIMQAIALIFPYRLQEQLIQLVNGPVWDGDVISKNHREELFAMGLAVRVCHKGEQGYTAAKYPAYTLLKRLPIIEQSK